MFISSVSAGVLDLSIIMSEGIEGALKAAFKKYDTDHSGAIGQGRWNSSLSVSLLSHSLLKAKNVEASSNVHFFPGNRAQEHRE